MKKYGNDSEVLKEVNGLTTHSLRASAATIALDRGAGLSRVKDWLGHENISTTIHYDHRDARLEDCPTYQEKC